MQLQPHKCNYSPNCTPVRAVIYLLLLLLVVVVVLKHGQLYLSLLMAREVVGIMHVVANAQAVGECITLTDCIIPMPDRVHEKTEIQMGSVMKVYCWSHGI